MSGIRGLPDIDLIAVTRGPGLMPSLLIGGNVARALSYGCRTPVIGVNHIEGHIFSNWLPPVRKISNLKFQISKKIEFPALILTVSGGHTELILMKDYGKYKIIGRTLDDAAGEAFDKTARLMGLGFPGGPAIAAEADKNQKSKIKNQKFDIKLPRPMINSNNYNFSFSGLKTAVLYSYNDLIKKYSPKEIKPAMAAEVQNAIIDVLTAKTIKAVKNLNPKTVMIAGGVSANKKLREKMAEKIAPYKIPLFAPDFAYTTDNGAMIAVAGYFSAIGGSPKGGNYPSKNSWKKIEANANLEL